MKQIIIYILAAVVVLGGAVSLYDTRKELGATKVLLNEQKAAVEALEARQARIAEQVSKVNAKAQASRVVVSTALGKEPAFRDTAVPAGVRDGLCQHIRCAK